MRPPSIATTSKRQGGRRGPAQQVVLRGMDDQPGGFPRWPRRTMVALRRRGAHLDEHQPAVALAQDQVDLAAAACRPRATR